MLAPRRTTIALAPVKASTQELTREGEDEFAVPAPEPLIDKFDLAYLLKKHLKILIIVPAIFAALVIGYFKFIKSPMFESSAMIYIDPQFDEILRLEKMQSGGSSEDLDSLTSLQVMIMADSMVLRVADKLNLRGQEGCLPQEIVNAPDQKLVEYLQRSRFSAQLVPETRLMKITALDPDASRSQIIASTFATEFNSFLMDQRQEEARKSRTVLEKQVVAARNAALEAENALKEFREQHPGLPFDQGKEINTLDTRLAKFSNDLDAVESQRIELESQIERLKDLDPDASPMVIVNITSYQSGGQVSDLLRNHSASSARLAAAKTQMERSTAQREFEQYDTQLKALAHEIKKAVTAKFEATKIREEGLRNQLAKVEKELVEMKPVTSQFRALKQQAERQWLAHENLQIRLNESVFAIDSASNIATEVSQPLEPYKAAGPSNLILLVAAIGLGGFLALAWVATRVISGIPFTNKNQLARFGLPVVADWSTTQSLPGPGRDAAYLHAIGAHKVKAMHFLSPDNPEIAGSVAETTANITAGAEQRTLLISIRQPGKDSKATAEPVFKENGSLAHLQITPQAAMQDQALANYLHQFGSQFLHIFMEAGKGAGEEITEWLSSLSNHNILLVSKDKSQKDEIESTLAFLNSPEMPPVALMMINPRVYSKKKSTPTKQMKQIPAKKQTLAPVPA